MTLVLGTVASFQFSTRPCLADLRTVALSGQPAPQTSYDVAFANFEAPVLNRFGQTAFKAFLSGTGLNSANDSGIWSEGYGDHNLNLVARAGSQAAGVSDGGNYSFLGLPVLNGNGQTAFNANLIGIGVDDSNNVGIWFEHSSGLKLIARRGDQAPGTPSGVLFNGLAPPVLNDAGQTAFWAGLIGPGLTLTSTGFWSEGSGTLDLVVRAGDYALGTPSGVKYSGFVDSPVLNAAGQIAFLGLLSGSNVDSSNNRGIWSETFNDLELVARQGNPAPGTSGEASFFRVYSPVINTSGHIAFAANLTHSILGIWSGGFDNLKPVVLTRTQAPGTPEGTQFFSVGSPVINSVGRISFWAALTGGDVSTANNEGIWSEAGHSGEVLLLARKGSHAAGTPTGTTYYAFDPPVINSAGQTAFLSTLSGTGVNFTNDLGIWGTAPSGTVQLVVRSGDLLEVAPSDFRTIQSVSFVANSGNEDGRRSGFNDSGQLVFAARFTDGSSGVFVSNAVAIPEPTSMKLFALLIPLILNLHLFRRYSQKPPS